MGDNICKSYICEWLITKIYEEFIQLNSKKAKQIWIKSGQRNWVDIFP